MSSVPDIWWSPTAGQFETRYRSRPQLIHTRFADARRRHQPERVETLPADAVRLVPDEMDLVDANERLGEALTEIGVALGLPTPNARIRWGAPQILARIASAAAAAPLRPTSALADVCPVCPQRCPACREHDEAGGAEHASLPRSTDV